MCFFSHSMFLNADTMELNSHVPKQVNSFLLRILSPSVTIRLPCMFIAAQKRPSQVGMRRSSNEILL